MNNLIRVLLCLAATAALPSKLLADDVILKSGSWKVVISSSNGAVSEISNPTDTTGMNWVHPARPWGLLILKSGTAKYDHPESVKLLNPQTAETTYESNGLQMTVRRSIGPDDCFTESYTLKNTGTAAKAFPEKATFLQIPFNDSYAACAPACLQQNCNTHLWAGGASSWVHAVRMGGTSPHLGLVLTKGSFAGYSILGGASSNDRGYLAFNPASFTLRPGEEQTVEWRMFWDKGWPDFWAKAIKQPGFVRLEAAHYTVVRGGEMKITARSAGSLAGAQLTQNGKEIQAKEKDGVLEATLPADEIGEQTFQIKQGDKVSWLKANVIEDPMKLIEARIRFILAHQQRNTPGDPLDGCYLAYDNETGRQILDKNGDHNEARERIGMGVLLARYLPLCKDAALRAQITDSLARYKAFIEREIQDSNGTVYNWAGYKDKRRPYNYPWVAHLHLAMYLATHDTKYLALYVKTVTAFYDDKTLHPFRFYALGMPITEGLNSLKQAGMNAEYSAALKDFTTHADSLEKIGGSYPKSEVNYEQSIVAPGVDIELQAYMVTKDPKYLASAKKQLVFLEAFNGQQPDFRLNDLGVRHWDDFWFGRIHVNGDTFPHYWSTTTAVAFAEFAQITGQEEYRTRARDILLNNLSLFQTDGSASCAYVYPLMIGNTPGQRADPWANDQDWALVNYLTTELTR